MPGTEQSSHAANPKMEGGTGDENAFEEMLRSELTKKVRFWALGTQHQDLALFEARFS
jgi:hypothetical protein